MPSTRKSWRDKIPAGVKRSVRQRCGFGCVICGGIVYEYDHVENYSLVMEHDENNLVLLCPNHHAEKTRRLLSPDVLSEANSSPYNLRTGSTTPYQLSFGGSDPKALIGSNLFTMENDDFAVFVIDGNPLMGFRFEDGRALLQLRVYDEKNRLVLKIVDSELVQSAALWDFEFVGSRLTLRPRNGEILLSLRMVPDENLVEVTRGTLRYNKVEVEIWPECIVILNKPSAFINLSFMGHVAFAFGQHAERYPAIIVDARIRRDFDRAAAKKYVKEVRSSANIGLE